MWINCVPYCNLLPSDFSECHLLTQCGLYGLLLHHLIIDDTQCMIFLHGLCIAVQLVPGVELAESHIW